jgi:hypothetical protein
MTTLFYALFSPLSDLNFILPVRDPSMYGMPKMVNLLGASRTVSIAISLVWLWIRSIEN